MPTNEENGRKGIAERLRETATKKKERGIIELYESNLIEQQGKASNKIYTAVGGLAGGIAERVAHSSAGTAISSKAGKFKDSVGKHTPELAKKTLGAFGKVLGVPAGYLGKNKDIALILGASLGMAIAFGSMVAAANPIVLGICIVSALVLTGVAVVAKKRASKINSATIEKTEINKELEPLAKELAQTDRSRVQKTALNETLNQRVEKAIKAEMPDNKSKVRAVSIDKNGNIRVQLKGKRSEMRDVVKALNGQGSNAHLRDNIAIECVDCYEKVLGLMQEEATSKIESPDAEEDLRPTRRDKAAPLSKTQDEASRKLGSRGRSEDITGNDARRGDNNKGEMPRDDFLGGAANDPNAGYREADFEEGGGYSAIDDVPDGGTKAPASTGRATPQGPADTTTPQPDNDVYSTVAKVGARGRTPSPSTARESGGGVDGPPPHLPARNYQPGEAGVELPPKDYIPNTDPSGGRSSPTDSPASNREVDGANPPAKPSPSQQSGGIQREKPIPPAKPAFIKPRGGMALKKRTVEKGVIGSPTLNEGSSLAGWAAERDARGVQNPVDRANTADLSSLPPPQPTRPVPPRPTSPPPPPPVSPREHHNTANSSPPNATTAGNIGNAQGEAGQSASADASREPHTLKRAKSFSDVELETLLTDTFGPGPKTIQSPENAKSHGEESARGMQGATSPKPGSTLRDSKEVADLGSQLKQNNVSLAAQDGTNSKSPSESGVPPQSQAKGGISK